MAKKAHFVIADFSPRSLRRLKKNLLSPRFFKKGWRSFKKHLNKQSPKIKKFIRYTLCVILLLLLLAPLWPRTGFHQAAWEVGKRPKNPQLHLSLAYQYGQLHHFGLSQKEVSLAKSLDPSFVYDNQTYLEEIFAERIKKQTIKKEITQWEEILKEYPGFRDVYLRLALLYWQIYDNLQADVYLKKAFLLSPNDPTVLQLHQFFQKNRP